MARSKMQQQVIFSGPQCSWKVPAKSAQVVRTSALKRGGLKRTLGKRRSILPLRGRVLVAHTHSMAIPHGNKTYFQLLLDPHKAELVKFLAKAKGVKATSWMRTTIYERLAEDYEQLFVDATEKDVQAKEAAKQKRREKFEQSNALHS